MKKRGLGKGRLLLFLILIGVVVTFFYHDRGLTGWIVYEGISQENIWNFDNPEEYFYDDALIEMDGGFVNLVSTTTTNYWDTTTETEYSLTKALYDPSDKTDKVVSIDNKKFEIKDNKIFEMFFQNELNDRDVISFYIKDGDEGEIYLCDKGNICNSPGYGLVNYDGEEGWYNVTIFGLSSPTKIFNLVVPEKIKVDFITSTQGNINKAYSNPSDKTSKLNALDNTKHEVDKNKILNLIFDYTFDNNDVISLYLKGGSETDIFLCDYGEVCSSPGYGLVNYEGEEGWYNITINGLSTPTNSFNLDPLKVKIDYVKAVHLEIEEHSSMNITYPTFAEIETIDFTPADLFQWGTFTSTEELNDQNVQYWYSIDSGESWQEIPENNNLSSVDGNKIRVKIVLNSDGITTPVLDYFGLSYITQVCIEDWSCGDWVPEICPLNEVQTRSCTDSHECSTEEDKPVESQSCNYQATCVDEIKNQDESDIDCGGSCDFCEDGKSCSINNDCLNDCVMGICGVSCVENWTSSYGDCLIDDTKLKYYLDENGCGTFDNIPEDNGTNVECDYCVPNLVNTSWSEWVDVGECSLNDLQLQVQTLIQFDDNGCNEVDNLTFTEKQEVDCDYCSIHNCSGSFENSFFDEGGLVLVDTENRTNVKLEINSAQPIESSNITVVEYNWTTKDVPLEVAPVDKYLEIESGLINMTSAKIIIYYTDEEINAANIDEETLKVHYFNETSQEWEELDSIVNTTGNYVYTIVSHFSLYGVFGEEQIVSGSSSGGSSGGGGSSRRTLAVEGISETIYVTGDSLKAAVEDEGVSETISFSEGGCDYVLEIFLPEKVSLITEDSFQGEIVNKGNCSIQKIDLFTGSKLSSIVRFSPSIIENLDTGNKNNFVLIRKTKNKEGLFSFLTGSAIVEKMIAQEVSGTITIEGTEDGESVFTKDLSLGVEVLSPEKIVKTVKIVFPSISFLMIFLLTVFVLIRRRKKKASKRIGKQS